MATTSSTRDLNKPRCGPCWRNKKGCDGKIPRCKRCELLGKDCDWPEEAQHSSSPTRTLFDSRPAKHPSTPGHIEMAVGAGQKRKREPDGERIRRKVIRVPRGPPEFDRSDCLPSPTVEDSLNGESVRPIPVVEITTPKFQEVMSDADLEYIAQYHRDFCQAQHDYLFAKSRGKSEELEHARIALEPFSEHFDRVGQEYEDFLPFSGTIIDFEDVQQFRAIELPWDDYLETCHTNCDGHFKSNNSWRVRPLPTMNVNWADPALANFTLKWNWASELAHATFMPAASPMSIEHHNVLQPDFRSSCPEKADHRTLAKNDADAKFAGEGHEPRGPNTFGEELSAVEVAKLMRGPGPGGGNDVE